MGDSMEQLLNTLKVLNDAKHNLDPEYIKNVTKLSTNMMKDLTKVNGKFLHNLHQVETNEETLQKMIDVCPASLSYKCEGYLPINRATWDVKSVQYVPFLAREGVRHNVGGSDGRGGLLIRRSKGIMNALEELASRPCDGTYLNMIQKLRNAKLFLKEDIQENNLLYHCSYKSPAKPTFEYLADIDPQALKAGVKFDQSGPFIHYMIGKGFIEAVQLIFTTALKHFPTDIGVLFLKNKLKNNQTAFEAALNKFGEKATFDMIKKCIPLDGAGTPLPILHRAAEHEPVYFNEIALRYPSSLFVRDQHGRSVNQIELASGRKFYRCDVRFYLNMSDDQVCEIDPGNGLYPFMVAACDRNRDLGGAYYLLRRNPSLLSRCIDGRVGNRKRRPPPAVKMEEVVTAKRRK